jgi:hypothetical protein
MQPYGHDYYQVRPPGQLWYHGLKNHYATRQRWIWPDLEDDDDDDDDDDDEREEEQESEQTRSASHTAVDGRSKAASYKRKRPNEESDQPIAPLLAQGPTPVPATAAAAAFDQAVRLPPRQQSLAPPSSPTRVVTALVSSTTSTSNGPGLSAEDANSGNGAGSVESPTKSPTKTGTASLTIRDAEGSEEGSAKAGTGQPTEGSTKASTEGSV